MKTIKFRGMTTNGDWRIGSLVSDTQKGVAIIQQRDNPVFMGEATGWCFGINPETVGQFTGLHDKNRREIYEGDVVRVDCSPVGGSFEDGVYVVVYILPDCAYCLESVDKKSTIQFNECYEYEVIGNIHENPELLNQ